jgi:polysaccharide biosynthesis/export protein
MMSELGWFRGIRRETAPRNTCLRLLSQSREIRPGRVPARPSGKQSEELMFDRDKTAMTLKTFLRGISILFVSGLLAACNTTNVSDALPRGEAALAVVPPPGVVPVPAYRIGAYDVLEINTFNEPGLTFKEVPVDSDGGFSFPFIGRIVASGQTPFELEQTIKNRLDERYTRNAQVTVFVKTAASQVFTVEGNVKSPGSYEYAGRTTLLDALARAGSPNVTANLKEVVVFRIVNNERYGAVFHVSDIREGKVPDPEIFAGDSVVVGYSAIKEGWTQFLSIGPIINAFTRF